ncbi:MAG: hypothetical protein QOE96_3986 [Blastocatellia bacterium]|jgi:hypothetical protein|nr:hypothetical protein [Blastocatellia bacterium]
MSVSYQMLLSDDVSTESGSDRVSLGDLDHRVDETRSLPGTDSIIEPL